MKKNMFDKLSDSYERFHLENSEINRGGNTVYISPKLKLTLGWSLFVLCSVLAYLFIGAPVTGGKTISQEDKKAVLDEEVDVKEEHDTIVPYEKDADEELNEFITMYYKAITSCDYLRLQDMVTEPSAYSDEGNLKKKAEFITAYDNITVYTKEGLDEGSYIAFVVANLTIAGVNSSPYDISILYIVNGARGYLINNGALSKDASAYIERVKGDKDIQKVFKAVEKKNNELKEKDSSLQEFYDIISRRDMETKSAADYLPSEEGSSEETGQQTEENSGESQPEENSQTPAEGQAESETQGEDSGETGE
ncbi:MAG: hypothetical protein NC300_00880 [Bacteroidales bacterium]|nr:hypothetical protein [Clostridium sp.]MCM1202678.1 hypothetical protein [Bacteroidales bacterium]